MEKEIWITNNFTTTLYIDKINIDESILKLRDFKKE